MSLDKRIALALFLIYLFLYVMMRGMKHVLLYIHTRLMRKKGILLLKEKISKIEVKHQSNMDFSFVTDDLGGTLIEQRETFNLEESVEFEKRLDRLVSYYQGIKKEIRESEIPGKVLKEEDIDYIINHVITKENITAAIKKLNDKRKANDAELAFIGNKMGLYEYDYGNKKMNWKCYRSDHFTWKIFKELYLMDVVPAGESKTPHQLFNELCAKLMKFQKKKEYRQVLMHTLCYLFSSLGIDLLITGKDCKNRRVCLASVRSARIDRSHTSRIHVSVDESFSDTDQLQVGLYTVEEWAHRGIEEEIGVPEIIQKENMKITYTDFSIVLGYGEIGLSGIVDGKDMDTLLSYPGMDKALESDGMFLVQMPGFCSLLKICACLTTGVQQYVARHAGTPMGKYPWVEFAPPIYFRTILRKLAFPVSWQHIFLFISLASFTLSMGYNWRQTGTWVFDGILWYLAVCVCLSLGHVYSRKYFRFSLWVPLWNGNVKTLQTTGRIVETVKELYVNRGLYWITEGEQGKTIKMDQLEIRRTPLCAVRRSFMSREVPISFYHVRQSDDKKPGNGHLRLFSSYYKDNRIYYYVISVKDPLKKSTSVLAYSFNFGLEKNVELRFDKKIENLDITAMSLQCYFGLHHFNMNDYIYCNQLPKVFDEEYRLCDLYEYKGDYYWSAYHVSDFSAMNIRSSLSMLYEQHKRVEEPSGSVCELTWEQYNGKRLAKRKDERVAAFQSVTPEGKTIFIEIFELKADRKTEFEKKINKLIERSLERFGGKLNELEVIALQYILVREDIFVADIRYNKLSTWLSVKNMKGLKCMADTGDYFKQ